MKKKIRINLVRKGQRHYHSSGSVSCARDMWHKSECVISLCAILVLNGNANGWGAWNGRRQWLHSQTGWTPVIWISNGQRKIFLPENRRNVCCFVFNPFLECVYIRIIRRRSETVFNLFKLRSVGLAHATAFHKLLWLLIAVYRFAGAHFRLPTDSAIKPFRGNCGGERGTKSFYSASTCRTHTHTQASAPTQAHH